MITLRHIQIYRKYSGDGDGFIRGATQDEKAIMDYKHWSLIDTLVQDLSIIRKGLASMSFIKSTDNKLRENSDSEETIQAIKDTSIHMLE